MRKYDEMMKPEEVGLDKPRWPFLFSTHLDTSKISRGDTLVFMLELVVTPTDYEIDGFLFFDRTIPGENLYNENLCIRATRNEDGWTVRCNRTSKDWGEKIGHEVEQDGKDFVLPLSNEKGFQGRLRLKLKSALS